MYAPKLQPLTHEERWTLGFHHRIDTKAAKIKAEIKEMADKARDLFKPPVTAVQEDRQFSDQLRMLQAQYAQYVPTEDRIRQQMAAMQNVYPLGAYSFGGRAQGPTWISIGNNPFGL